MPAHKGNRRVERSYYRGDYVLEDHHEYGIDRRGFEIHLSGIDKVYGNGSDDTEEPGVEYQMATRFIKNLRILTNLNPRAPILIHMKSCGGDYGEGMAIFNAIRLCTNPITILAYVHARSMSSIILQGADKRVFMPDAYFMFHRGTMCTFGEENAAVSIFLFYLLEQRYRMVDIYAAKMKASGRFSKWSIKRIKEMLESEMDKRTDAHLTPQESIRWGLADAIFDGNWNKLRTSKKIKNMALDYPADKGRKEELLAWLAERL
jgi:ATP-dependent protease ClpP protease subunit